MTTQPTEQGRKRYYIVSLDMTRTSGDNFDWVNREEALVGGRLAGRIEHKVPGTSHPLLLGLPELREKPKIIIRGSGKKALDFYGPNPIFVSNRAKQMLEAADAEAFQFAECETSTRTSEPIEPYWWLTVIRVVHMDEQRSNFQRYKDDFPDAPDAEENPVITRLNDIHMPQDFPSEFHAFWIDNYRRFFIFDEKIVDAWRAAKLTGPMFTPVQEPTETDRKNHLSFVNYPFWDNRMKQP